MSLVCKAAELMIGRACSGSTRGASLFEELLHLVQP